MTKGRTQLAKCLPPKHENLMSTPNSPIKKAWHSYMCMQAGTGQGETGRCLASLASQHHPLSELQAFDRPCLKKQGRWFWE